MSCSISHSHQSINLVIGCSCVTGLLFLVKVITGVTTKTTQWHCFCFFVFFSKQQVSPYFTILSMLELLNGHDG